MIESKIKVCGITNLEDAKLAIELGADILGFNFYHSSPRYIAPKKVANIVKQLPTITGIAGLFVDAPFDYIQQIADECMLDWIQLHGDETPEFCDQFRFMNVRTIKAIRVKGIADLERANKFRTDVILFDNYIEGLHGGTGQQFDWDMLRQVIAYIDRRIMLSGGISEENAREAVEMGIYGIDVCSSIESEPGVKDYEKMRRLFQEINS